jgi:tRNA A-37 threonylcarbamoyl transferase component Bud32/tetratricopeptide (TPR) repeat protein
MDPTDDLRLLLRGLADGLVDPNLLALVAADWDGRPGLMPFLARRGVIAADDLARLAEETSVHPGRAAAGEAPSTTVGATPAVRPPADPNGRAPAGTRTFDPARPRAEPTTTFDPPRGRWPGPAAPGNGRYQVIRHHRTGGLGQVWLARDTVVGREVALKTLRPDRASGPDVRARFVREARVTGQLEHPGIVPLYDLVGDEDDAFYVMRFVSGRTLAEATADYHRRRAAGEATPLDLADLLDAFVAVCRAVAFAHARGVLHRDLKGQNVVLGEYGEVFLLDWGLGKSAGAGPDTPPPAAALAADGSTADGVVVGTPAYMAPEVAGGAAASAGSDVYALGAMLYAILAGQPPYSGSSVQEVLGRVVADPPPPVRGLNPAAPPALVAVCDKAMARATADRYASADEVATEVRRFLADEPVRAYREPLPARAWRWARRHRTLVAAAAAVLLVAAVASAVGAVLIDRERRETVRERDRAEANFALAWEVSAGLGRLAGQTEGGLDVSPDDPARLALLRNIAAVSERVLAARPDDPDLRTQAARVLWHAGHLGQYLNDIGPADRSYREAVRLQEGLADQFPDDPEHRFQLSRVHRDRAFLLRRAGRLGEASAAADAAVAAAERAGEADPGAWEPQFLQALALTARWQVEMARGRYAAAAQAAGRSADLLDDLLAAPRDRSHPYAPLFRAEARSLVAVALREAARAAGGAWDPGPALELHDDAVARLRGLVAEDGRRDFVYHLYAALVERAETARLVPGRQAQAGEDLDEAIRGLGPMARDHPQVPFYKEELARGLIARGRLRAAAARAAGPDLAGLLRAEADFRQAVRAAWPLAAVHTVPVQAARRGGPAVDNALPVYLGLLGDAWAGLAPLADDRAALGGLGWPADPWAGAARLVAARKALQTRVHNARSSFRQAALLCPDSPTYPRRLKEIEQEWGEVARWVDDHWPTDRR